MYAKLFLNGSCTYRAILMLFFTIKCIFKYVFAKLVKPMQTLGASCCFPKKRIGSNHDIVWHENIFGQVTLIFIVVLFVGLI